MVVALILALVIAGLLIGLTVALISYLFRLVLSKFKRRIARWTNAVPAAMVAITEFQILTHVPFEDEEAGGPYYISPTGQLRAQMAIWIIATLVTFALTYRAAFGARHKV